LERARIRRDAPNGISSILVHRLQYNVNEGPEKLSSLRRCLGKVDTVSLINCMNENTMPSLHALLRVGIRIDTLILDTENMTEIVAANILEIMDAVQINDIRISVGDTSTDPVKLLISLASRVHTLAINQLPVHGVNRDARFFLGEHFCNWNHTFVSMLGHARRLDKLCIDNIAYPRYLWSARTLAKVHIFVNTFKYRGVIHSNAGVYPLFETSSLVNRKIYRYKKFVTFKDLPR
ncbi:hypothetical protein PMAYCL1PPCAC_20512, partial [Pristionchus mayeri]